MTAAKANPGGRTGATVSSLWTLGSSRLFKEGLWVALGQLATAAGLLAGLKLITSLVPPAVYGEFVLLLGLTVLARDFFCGPLLQAVLRFYPEALRDQKVNAFRRTAGFSLAGGGAMAAVLLLGGGTVWNHITGAHSSYLAFPLVAGLFALDLFKSFENALLNASRRQKEYSLWIATDAWARPLLAALFVSLVGPTAVSLLLGYAGGSFLTYVTFHGMVVRGGDPPEDRRAPWTTGIRREVLRYAGPLFPLAALIWITNLGDRYFLAALSGVNAAGIYAAAYGLASQPFIAFSGIVHSTLRPVVFDAVARDDRARARQALALALGALALGGAVGVVLVWTLSGVVVRLFLGGQFRAAAVLMPWIAGAYALQGVQQLFELIIYAHRKTKLFIVLYGVAAGSALFFYWLLIPRAGARGAAMATLASFVLSCLVSSILGALAQGKSLRKVLAADAHAGGPGSVAIRGRD